MSEIRIMPTDVIQGGYCARGLKQWFELNAAQLPPGLTLRRFLAEGASIEELRPLAAHDEFVAQLIKNKGA